VHDAPGLRVVSASLMSTHPATNINGSIIMVVEMIGEVKIAGAIHNAVTDHPAIRPRIAESLRWP
jgi:choline dehydrogenase-like flavoprotein